MDNSIIVYFVAEHGFMNQEMVELFLSNFEEKGYSIEDIGMGSAYNMPIYLLGEIEAHRDKAVVVSFRMDDGRPVPMIFFSKDEVDAVFKALEEADKSDDSFDIITQVHRKIRG